MLLDLRESVPEVDLDVFFDRGILPDLRDGLDAQTVFNNMKAKEDGVLYKGGRWKAFATAAIMQKRGHEDDVYGSLAEVVDAIQRESGLNTSEVNLSLSSALLALEANVGLTRHT